MSTGVRPPHLRWAAIGLVILGGAGGAAGREGVTLIIPDLGAVPVAILVVNLLGAFLLGFLYEALTRMDSASLTGRNLKLLLGTGFCGGFTTYSALAAGIVTLLRDGLLFTALMYAFGTVFLGACATWAGLAAGSVNGRGQGRRHRTGQGAAS
ncbi:CrcB protein [Arthrobacter sp. UYP6]|uniref:fluoride efflux transporter FluC n=1 Tax=Arthrobacter sp. UYP6 TaxID=1756378 RepID=UPI003398E30D